MIHLCSLAAGLSIERDKVDEFRASLNNYAATMYRYMPSAQITIDFKINPSGINLQMLHSIERFQPFGMGNSKPLFGIYGAKVLSIIPVSGDRHIKLNLSKNETTFSAMYFGHSTRSVPFQKGDFVDLALSVERNTYNGTTSVSLFVKAIKFSGFDDDKMIGGKTVFENFMRGECNRKEINYLCVSREHIAQTYRFIRDNNGWGYTNEELFMRMRPQGMNFSQMLLSVSIMKELGILIEDKQRRRLDLPLEQRKVNIPDSALFQKMTELDKIL